MKFPVAIVASAWLCALAMAAREDGDELEADQPLIDCHGVKVTLFGDAKSKDGHYGVGWTILPGKEGKPVDWSHYAKEGGREFANEHMMSGAGEYTMCFVDIPGRKSIVLPAVDPYWWHENHADLGVFWSAAGDGARYCLVQNQKRFATDELFLIRIDKSGMSQANIIAGLNKAVKEVLGVKRPLYANIMAISYPGSEWEDAAGEPVFHASTVEIPFNADLPKAGYDKMSGRLVVSLPGGKVQRIICDAKPDDPFHDDAALAQADRELNNVYAILQKQLNPARRAELKKEQQKWIAGREADLAENYPMPGDDVEAPAFTVERNKDLVKSTRERTAILKTMVATERGF